jgi:DinB superfamily
MSKLEGYTLLPLVIAIIAPAFGQASETPAAEVTGQFERINRLVLEMAKDFPADKYNFKLRPEMRTFGAVIVHIASGNIFAAKYGRGEKVKWDELDPANYKTKADIVALLQKSIDDSTATLKSLPAETWTKTVSPWLDVLEHSAEHYGLLVAYYRANGLVPPSSRPKPSK